MSDAGIKITVSANGSYKVEGACSLTDAEGNPIETREGKPFFLCRCDGSHKSNDWDPTLAAR